VSEGGQDACCNNVFVYLDDGVLDDRNRCDVLCRR
jgi:hypothetical protein